MLLALYGGPEGTRLRSLP